MAYSQPITTSIFNKLSCDGCWRCHLFGSPERRRREAVMRTDLRRLGFGAGVTETRYPAVTCVSTLSLCNANFARS